MIKFSSLESLLNQYKIIDIKIKDLEIELKNCALDGIEAIDYSRDKLCNSYKISSIVENLAFKENKEKIIIEKELKYLRYLKEKIDNSLNILNERDRKIIELRYIHKIPNFNIAKRFCISESAVKKARRESITKIKKVFQ